MADEINFSGKLAKKIELDKVKPDGVQNDRKDKVASLFNKQKGGNDASILTADELVVLNQIDKNHDGKITDDEIKTYYNANYKDNQTNNPNQVTEAEYISYVKAMAKANQEALEADSTNVGNAYTVQLGEGLDDLATRVAKSIKSNPSAEDIADIKQQIINLNKTNGAIKFDGNGNVKWLVGGQQLILPTDTTSARAKKNVKDQNNKAQVESKYKAWRDGRGPLKSFTYKIDDDGKTYEVRGSEEKEFDASKMYSVDSGDYEVTSVKEEDIVNYDAIEFEEGKADETKAKIKTAIDAINSLTDKENIDGTPTRNGNEVTIKLKDGGKIVVNYGDSNDRTKVTDIEYYPKDAQNPTVKFDHNNKLFANGTKGGMNSGNAGGVKDWSALTEIVEDAMAYDVQEITDLSVVDSYDGDYKDKKPEIKNKIKKSNDVLDLLRDESNITNREYKQNSDGTYTVTLTVKDDKVYIDYTSDGKLSNVQVEFKGSSTTDVGYYSDGKLDVEMNNDKNEWEVFLDNAADFNKVKKLIPASVNTKVAQMARDRNKVTPEYFTATNGDKYYTKIKYEGNNNSISLDGGVVVGPAGAADKDIKFTIDGKDYCFKKEKSVMDHTYDFYDLLGCRGNGNDYLINPRTGEFNYNWSGFNDGNKLYFDGDGDLKGATLVRYNNKVALAVKNSDNSVTYYDMNEYMHGRQIIL